MQLLYKETYVNYDFCLRKTKRNAPGLQPPIAQVYSLPVQANSPGLQPGIFCPNFQTSFLLSKQQRKYSFFFTHVEERLKFTYIFLFNRYCAGFPQNKVICSKMIKNHSWNIKFNHFRLKIVFQNSKRSFQDIQQLH